MVIVQVYRDKTVGLIWGSFKISLFILHTVRSVEYDTVWKRGCLEQVLPVLPSDMTEQHFSNQIFKSWSASLVQGPNKVTVCQNTGLNLDQPGKGRSAMLLLLSAE